MFSRFLYWEVLVHQKGWTFQFLSICPVVDVGYKLSYQMHQVCILFVRLKFVLQLPIHFFVVEGFWWFQTGLMTRCAPWTRDTLCDVGPYVLLLRGVRSDAVLLPPNVTRNTPVLSRMPWAGGGKLLMDDWRVAKNTRTGESVNTHGLVSL